MTFANMPEAAPGMDAAASTRIQPPGGRASGPACAIRQAGRPFESRPVALSFSPCRIGYGSVVMDVAVDSTVEQPLSL